MSKEIKFPLSKAQRTKFENDYELIFFKKPVHNISDEKLVEAVQANFTKVLYANFEAIFTDIEKAVPNFYKLNYNVQWEKLNEFVKPYLEEINPQNEPLRIYFGTQPMDTNPTDPNNQDVQQ